MRKNLINSSLNVLITRMYKFIHLVNAGVLFEDAFCLWVFSSSHQDQLLERNKKLPG